MGQAVGVERSVFLGAEEWQALAHCRILQRRRLAGEAIADNGLRGEEVWDRGLDPDISGVRMRFSRRSCHSGRHFLFNDLFRNGRPDVAVGFPAFARGGLVVKEDARAGSCKACTRSHYF